MREWGVTYLRVGREIDFKCIQVIDNKRRWCEFKGEYGSRVTEKVLAELPESKKHLVIVDGYLEDEDNHKRVYEECR
eukprot:726285-Hanusia_phi.AAC.1